MKLFNPGSELANLTVTSGVLQLSWKEINAGEQSSSSSSSSSLGYRIYREPKRSTTVVTFSAPRVFASRNLEEGQDLVSSSSSTAKESFALFGFLRKKTGFAINRAAITLFHENLPQLTQLKNQIIRDVIMDKNYSSPVIVTGHSLGGSIASLFTLWLLESVTFSNKKRPLCITFGSPLFGDTNLQKALSKYTPWSSCFLHVVSNQDPVPRMFMFATDKDYQPFGAYLLCSESECSCFEEPETVLKLLSETAPKNQNLHQIVDYGEVVDGLKRKALFKNMVDTNIRCTNPYQAGIVTQLLAIGVVVSSPPPEGESEITTVATQGKTEIETLAEEIEMMERKFQIRRNTVNPDKRLNNSKIQMAKVEWYKKSSKDIGYYDSYKKKRFPRDINIEECVKRLMNYWTDLVEEADMKPQTEIETLRTRWLFSGLNYMRLVEPLYIADHYHEKGLSDYMSQGRPKHFARLEALVAEAKQKEILENKKKKDYSTSIDSKKKNIGAILTEDSCFWARVEEANISCKLMTIEGTSNEDKNDCVSELVKFEDYVLALIKDYAVSPEIFLPESSFMKWWNDYKELDEAMRSYGKTTSLLNDIMEKGKYKRYFEGKL